LLDFLYELYYDARIHKDQADVMYKCEIFYRQLSHGFERKNTIYMQLNITMYVVL